MYVNTVFAFLKTLYIIFNVEEKKGYRKMFYFARDKLDLLFFAGSILVVVAPGPIFDKKCFFFLLLFRAERK